MDLSNNLAKYSKLQLKKVIFNNDSENKKQDAEFIEHEDDNKKEEFSLKKVDIDALSALEIYNRGLINIETVINGALSETDSTGSSGTTLEDFLAKLAGNEFDKEVTKEEADSVIKQLTDLMKADLKEKYGFSDEFLDAVIEFAVTELGLKGATTTHSFNSNPPKYNLKNLLNSVKKDIESLTGEAVFYKTRVHEYDGGIQTENWHEINIDNCLDKTSYTFSFIIPYYDCIGEKDDPYNRQSLFLQNLFKETFDKLQLDSNNDQWIFKYMLLDKISERIGVSSELITPRDIMTKLDSNGNNSWIDEIYDIVNNLTNELYIPDYQNAVSVNADVLLNGADSIDAKYISDNLLKFKFMNDAGTRKFGEIVEIALETVNNYYDELEMINTIIRLLNNKCGIPNTNPPTLTKEAIEQLNNNDIFKVLEEIVNGDELWEEYYFGSIDGEFGDNGQGATGDCWLLTGINAFRNSSVGRQILKDAIKINDDGTYSVTLNGVNRTYTFTQDDIINAIYAHGYSHGDRDVLLMELAVEELHKEIIDGTVTIPTEVMTELSRETDEPGSAICGGSSTWLTYYLTGNISKSYEIDSAEFAYSVLDFWYEEFINGNVGFELSFHLDLSYLREQYGINAIFGAIDINGLQIIENHAYNVEGITIADPSDPAKNTISLSNPWEPEIVVTFTWEELVKIGIFKMEMLNIAGVESTIGTNMDKYADKWFDQFINGEISASELWNKMSYCAANGYFSKETEDYIFNKWLLLYTEGYIDIKWPYPPVGDWESGKDGDGIGVNDSYGMQFEMNGSVYVISKGSKNGSQSFMSDDILKYTTDTDIINQFFDIAATKDGQPYIYRLKEGLSMDDFVNAVNSNNGSGDTEDINGTEEPQSENGISAAEDAFIKLFTGMSNPFNAKRNDYYRIFLYNYDALGSFDMQPVYVNEKGQYVSTSNPSRGLFSNFFDTVKALINDIPNGNLVLESIGGDDRLREILMNIWNSYAPQSSMDIEWLFNDIFDSIFSTYGELESYM